MDPSTPWARLGLWPILASGPLGLRRLGLCHLGLRHLGLGLGDCRLGNFGRATLGPLGLPIPLGPLDRPWTPWHLPFTRHFPWS